MTINSLSPAFLKLYSTFSTITHVMTLPVVPSGTWTPGVQPDLATYGGGSQSLESCMSLLMPVLRPFFGSTTEFNRVEAWHKPTPESDPIWIYTSVIALPGLAASASANNLQGVVTFRTNLGGMFKFYMMEMQSGQTVNLRDPYPFTTTIATNLANMLMAATSFVYGRDGGKLVVPMYYTTKYNDALRKRRLGI